MKFNRSTIVANTSLLLASSVQATIFLAPEQDILLPSSESAINPLAYLGANSPYFAGPNINDISNTVPTNCHVEQASYNVRHGSRYPDQGAFTQWSALHTLLQTSNYTSHGPLSFLKSWKPVLSNPSLQIAQESPTGFKEAYDLGYQLRTRYPHLYHYGDGFIAWANLYPRVVSTARNFMRGFLGERAHVDGVVVTVNATGGRGEALFDSLSPSDSCPDFVDGNGGLALNTWNGIYLPRILTRLRKFITGTLDLTTVDVSLFPYLCGFESQILGSLSPWCAVLTDAELRGYEYAQDLRYFYGVGPGRDLESKIMLPYLDAVLEVLDRGPRSNGTGRNGEGFTVPSVLMAFMNDGQIVELGAATGIWDGVTSLGDGTEIPRGYGYIASRFVSMRGTVAFEKLSCSIPTSFGSGYNSSSSFSSSSSNSTTTPQKFIRILLNDAVYPVPGCDSGPGSSCLLSEYRGLIKRKVEEAGDLPRRCNVTGEIPGNLKGASFFTDLRGSWLEMVRP